MKRKVLVIEDEPVIAEMMAILLEVGGFKVIGLADTSRAREKLTHQDIAVVVLDLRLKGEDGQSLCAYIKGQADLNAIPVLLVSANPDLAQICKACGANDFIAKPFHLDDFVSKINNLTGCK
jgi:DNA-binding response OmpR family regulator